MIPSRAHALAGGDGRYVLASIGKGISRPSMVLDDYSTLRDERRHEHKNKNSMTWIVGVVLLVTIALGMTAIFASSIYTTMSKVYENLIRFLHKIRTFLRKFFSPFLANHCQF